MTQCDPKLYFGNKKLIGKGVVQSFAETKGGKVQTLGILMDKNSIQEFGIPRACIGYDIESYKISLPKEAKELGVEFIDFYYTHNTSLLLNQDTPVQQASFAFYFQLKSEIDSRNFVSNICEDNPGDNIPTELSVDEIPAGFQYQIQDGEEYYIPGLGRTALQPSVLPVVSDVVSEEEAKEKAKNFTDMYGFTSFSREMTSLFGLITVEALIKSVCNPKFVQIYRPKKIPKELRKFPTFYEYGFSEEFDAYYFVFHFFDRLQ